LLFLAVIDYFNAYAQRVTKRNLIECSEKRMIIKFYFKRTVEIGFLMNFNTDSFTPVCFVIILGGSFVTHLKL
jgi:hypothetical protein